MYIDEGDISDFIIEMVKWLNLLNCEVIECSLSGCYFICMRASYGQNAISYGQL